MSPETAAEVTSIDPTERIGAIRRFSTLVRKAYKVVTGLEVTYKDAAEVLVKARTQIEWDGRQAKAATERRKAQPAIPAGIDWGGNSPEWKKVQATFWGVANGTHKPNGDLIEGAISEELRMSTQTGVPISQLPVRRGVERHFTKLLKAEMIKSEVNPFDFGYKVVESDGPTVVNAYKAAFGDLPGSDDNDDDDEGQSVSGLGSEVAGNAPAEAATATPAETDPVVVLTAAVEILEGITSLPAGPALLQLASVIQSLEAQSGRIMVLMGLRPAETVNA